MCVSVVCVQLPVLTRPRLLDAILSSVLPVSVSLLMNYCCVSAGAAEQILLLWNQNHCCLFIFMHMSFIENKLFGVEEETNPPFGKHAFH